MPFLLFSLRYESFNNTCVCCFFHCWHTSSLLQRFRAFSFSDKLAFSMAQRFNHCINSNNQNAITLVFTCFSQLVACFPLFIVAKEFDKLWKVITTSLDKVMFKENIDLIMHCGKERTFFWVFLDLILFRLRTLCWTKRNLCLSRINV